LRSIRYFYAPKNHDDYATGTVDDNIDNNEINN